MVPVYGVMRDAEGNIIEVVQMTRATYVDSVRTFPVGATFTTYQYFPNFQVLALYVGCDMRVFTSVCCSVPLIHSVVTAAAINLSFERILMFLSVRKRKPFYIAVCFIEKFLADSRRVVVRDFHPFAFGFSAHFAAANSNVFFSADNICSCVLLIRYDTKNITFRTARATTHCSPECCTSTWRKSRTAR